MERLFDINVDVPYIHNTEELQEWMQPLYIIDNIMESKESYDKFMKRHMNLLRGSFDIRECREMDIRFKFYQNDKAEHKLQFRHFMVNMILWGPFVELHGIHVLNEGYIMDCFTEAPKVENFINYKLINTLRFYRVKSTKINQYISDVLHGLRSISIDFSIIMGCNFSIVTFLEMYQKYPEIREIMETTFSENMQPYEIESELAEIQDKMISFIKSIPGNPIGTILAAGSGMKTKQLTEFMASEGLKPSLEGQTIPIPIENSTLLKGLDRPSYLYIDAIGARKSLVMNKKVMGRAGYFGKNVLKIARTVSMSKTVSDCGTKHLVPYKIKSKAHLAKLNGKYYKEDLMDFDYKLLDSSVDKDLIGKTIYVRSAVTCCLGNQVCAKCIGSTAATNLDIADGISAFDSEEVTKVVNQSILSTKHLLTTNSEVIEFNPEFHKFFTIVGGEINPVVNENTDVENIEEYAIYIDPDDIVKLEEQDYDSLYNNCISNGKFYIRNVENPEVEDIVIQAEGEKEIFLTELALDAMRRGKGLIYFKDLDDDEKLFEMVIMNQELTKPLYQLINFKLYNLVLLQFVK